MPIQKPTFPKSSNSSLPPPNEMLADHLSHQKLSSSRTTGSRNPPAAAKQQQQPLTTKDKTAAVKAKKERAARKAAAEKSAQRGRKERQKAREKVNLMDFFRTVGTGFPAIEVDVAAERGDAGGEVEDSVPVRQSVLVRMTQRSQKRNLDVAKAAAQEARMSAARRAAERRDASSGDPDVLATSLACTAGVQNADDHGSKKNKKTLLDLPVLVRHRIFKEAVVETAHFLWPLDGLLGREQPDLAMTCRQIRAEVLQVFYGETVFGVDICNDGGRKSLVGGGSGGVEERSSMVMMEEWCKVLSEKGWVQRIRKWAFSYFPPSTHAHKRRPVSKLDDTDVVISLVYPPPAPSASLTPSIPNTTSTAPASPTNPVITIHRSALCLATGHRWYAPCSLGPRVQWLEDLVEETNVPVARRQEQVLAVAKVLEERAGELVRGRCVEMKGRVE